MIASKKRKWKFIFLKKFLYNFVFSKIFEWTTFKMKLITYNFGAENSNLESKFSNTLLKNHNGAKKGGKYQVDQFQSMIYHWIWLQLLSLLNPNFSSDFGHTLFQDLDGTIVWLQKAVRLWINQKRYMYSVCRMYFQ